MNETDRTRAHGITDDRRQPGTNVVQRLEQRQRPLEHAAPARNPGRRDQHQPPNPIRLLQRQLRRHQPAQRVSENVHPAEPDGVEQTPQPRRHLTRTQAPQPRQLDQTEPPALGKPPHERLPPTPRARQPVYHHQILPLPHDPAAHRFPVDHDPPQLHTSSLKQVELVARAGGADRPEKSTTAHRGGRGNSIAGARFDPVSDRCVPIECAVRWSDSTGR